jgi:hypothetical protein
MNALDDIYHTWNASKSMAALPREIVSVPFGFG